MATIAEKFLETERAASALLDELSQLKSETQHYSAAALALDDASRGLRELAATATDLVTDTRGLVIAMREMGTPEILERLEQLAARQEEQREQLQEFQKGVQILTERTEAISSALEMMTQRLDASINSIGSRLDTVTEATEQLLQRRPWWALGRR